MRAVIYLFGKNIIHCLDQVISIQLDHQIDKECATHHYDSLKLSFMLEIAFKHHPCQRRQIRVASTVLNEKPGRRWCRLV